MISIAGVDKRWIGAALACVAAVSLGGCAVNPATGDVDLILLSAEDERRLGAQEHPKISRQFGGAYDLKRLTDYVTGVGRKLAAHAEYPADRFRFTVLDTPIVNAFALPGGYIYMTRGLVALAGNEAELAGVLAHEIGHVTARHSAQHYSRQMLTGLGAGVLGAVTRSRAARDLANLGGTLYLRGYSRDQESQADTLGIRYLTRAGYDPGAMASFLAKMGANARFQAKLRGGADNTAAYNLLATHPRTIDRVRQARSAAQVKAVGRARLGRRDFLTAIDGVVHGSSRRQGFIRGRRFVHPMIGVEFTVPTGYRLTNLPDRVVAAHRQGPTVIFDQARRDGLDLMGYVMRSWAPRLKLRQRERITVNGLPAVTASGRTRIKGQVRDLRLLAIGDGGDGVFRFAMIAAPTGAARWNRDMRAIAHSFRRLSVAEARSMTARRLKIIPVGRRDTVDALAGRMAVDDHKRGWFELLNGLDLPGAEPPKACDLVKIVR
ncbi:MAG: M48 family metalloprotease [Pseudomonadota bacterium]|nr:M48 family metalloprotease [Pseudomonadota bacterium]